MKVKSTCLKLLRTTLVVFLFVQVAPAQMKVHFINVGQGSSCLIEFPCAAILIDAGGEKNDEFNSNEKLRDYLDAFFDERTDLKRTLQCFYITHPHIDHTRGIPTLLEARYSIKNLVTNGMISGSGKAQQVKMHNLVEKAQATATKTDNIGFVAVSEEEVPKKGLTNKIIDPVNCTGTDPSIKILWGEMIENPGLSEKEFYDENNNSLVIKFEYGEASILFTGDLEEGAINELLKKYSGSTLLDADVYVAGHHGSKNGTTAELLDAISPDYAVISMGDVSRELTWTAWKHGHPHKDVLEVLQTKVSKTRKSITVQAGSGAKTFEDYTVKKAIYATGWDDDVEAVAEADGSWSFNGTAPLSKPAKININTASKTELVSLPHIAEKRAQAIVDYRTSKGAFKSIDDVAKVPGINETVLELISAHVKFK